MRREDWMVAGIMGGFVAIVVVALGTLPLGWATDVAFVSIPSLSPATLNIPEIGEVTASAEREPGKPVEVSLSLTTSSDRYNQSVPVTVSVYRRDFSVYVSRSAQPPAAIAVVKVDCSLVIDSDGQARTTVVLPALVWTADEPTTDTDPPVQQTFTEEDLARTMASYYIQLSSPLLPQVEVTVKEDSGVQITNTVIVFD